MKRLILIIAAAAIGFTGCKTKMKNDNPFFSKWDTPYEVPPFDKIKAGHFMPAYLKAFEEQKKEISAIINNKKEPSFDNTIRALEYSGQLLTKVSRVFGALNSAHTNDSLQAINMEIAPLLSRHRDDINLNDSLFQRVRAVYDNMDKFDLTEEEQKVLDNTYKNFVRSGAALSPEDKEKLRKINEEHSLLTVKFGQNLLAETNDFILVIDKREDLAKKDLERRMRKTEKYENI